MQIPTTDNPPLIRTDFTDDAGWRAVIDAVKGESEDGFVAYVAIVDDPAFSGAEPATLMAALADRTQHAIAFVVDAATLADDEMPILCLDLLDGANLRVVPSELWSIENNVSVGNMGFEDFVDEADADGVFRGFD